MEHLEHPLLGSFPSWMMGKPSQDQRSPVNANIEATWTKDMTGWWFGTWLLFLIYWECHHPNWLSSFSEGWLNHQPDDILYLLLFTPIWTLKNLQNGFWISWKHDLSILKDHNSAANVRCWWFFIIFHWKLANKSASHLGFLFPDQKWWHLQRMPNWLGISVGLGSFGMVWVYHLIWWQTNYRTYITYQMWLTCQ